MENQQTFLEITANLLGKIEKLLFKDLIYSNGVGTGVQAYSQKFRYVEKLDKIFKKLGKDISTFFYNTDEIMFLC